MSADKLAWLAAVAVGTEAPPHDAVVDTTGAAAACRMAANCREDGLSLAVAAEKGRLVASLGPSVGKASSVTAPTSVWTPTRDSVAPEAHPRRIGALLL